MKSDYQRKFLIVNRKKKTIIKIKSERVYLRKKSNSNYFSLRL